MKPKAILKLAVDVVMTLALLFLMGYQFWGEVPHEWVGAGMFVLFIAHHILNGKWHKTLFKGKYNAMRIATLVIDVLVLVSMLAQMYSGIVMSRYVFGFLPTIGGMSLARRLHILGAYWGLSPDEPAFRTALEFNFRNCPKSGRDKKQGQKPQYDRFHRRIGYRRIWRMGIYPQRFSDLFVFEKRVCISGLQ